MRDWQSAINSLGGELDWVLDNASDVSEGQQTNKLLVMQFSAMLEILRQLGEMTELLEELTDAMVLPEHSYFVEGSTEDFYEQGE